MYANCAFNTCTVALDGTKHVVVHLNDRTYFYFLPRELWLIQDPNPTRERNGSRQLWTSRTRRFCKTNTHSLKTYMIKVLYCNIAGTTCFVTYPAPLRTHTCIVIVHTFPKLHVRIISHNINSNDYLLGHVCIAVWYTQYMYVILYVPKIIIPTTHT